MRVILAVHQSLRAAARSKNQAEVAYKRRKRYVPGSGITDDGDISAGKTDDSVYVLNDDAKKGENGSGRGVAGAGDTVAADLPRGGSATSGCGDRKSGEGKGNEGGKLHSGLETENSVDSWGDSIGEMKNKRQT
jgi:hypothetical protein